MHRENPVTTSTTSDIDQILEIIISTGLTGVTIRCSSVPRSRSRINAAPVRMRAIMAMLLMSSLTAPSQLFVRFGLNRLRMMISAL